MQTLVLAQPAKSRTAKVALAAAFILALGTPALAVSAAQAVDTTDRFETTIDSWRDSGDYVHINEGGFGTPTVFTVPGISNSGPIEFTDSDGNLRCLETEQSSPFFMLSWGVAADTTCQSVTTVLDADTGLVGFMATDGEYQGRYLGDESEAGIVDWAQEAFFGVNAPDVPEPDPDPTLVVPDAPTLVPAAECGVEATINTPETTGVSYSQQRDGNTITITATPLDGYAFDPGTQTEWIIELPEIEVCDPPVTPEQPTSPEKPADTKLADTGSSSNIALWVSAAALSIVGAGTLLLRRRTS